MNIYIKDVNIIMSPHHGAGGHVVFSVDPVGGGGSSSGGGGGGVATCLHSVSLLNGQILAKLTQIYHWEGEKC